MSSILMKLAHIFYRATPFSGLRSAYFKVYSFVVRNRTVRSEIDGAVFELDLGEVIDLAMYLELFEPDVVQAIKDHTKPGMSVIDIGANIGAHTLRFCNLVGKTGHVYAFEPTSYAFLKLKRNLSLNYYPQASAINVALSDENLASREIRFRSSWKTNGKNVINTDHVEFIRLDDWCDKHSVDNIGLIKIDVDGNEFPILVGGLVLIKRCKPLLIMEAVGPHFDDDARNPFKVLAQIGYRFRDTKTGVDYGGIDEMREILPRNDLEMTKSINVIAYFPVQVE
jgi:FkbM family methyltransferase